MTAKTPTDEPLKISRAENGKAYLVERKNTLELRVPPELKTLLIEKYETVMESRYFGRGGIEIVPGQISQPDLDDLIRLSLSLTSSLS